MIKMFYKSSAFTKLILLMPFMLLAMQLAGGPANACQDGKYYLPYYAVPAVNYPAANNFNLENTGNLKASTVLAALKCPAQVRAGDSFTITLTTGKDFPLLSNQEVVFFETFEGQSLRRIGKSTLDDRGKAELQLTKKTAGKYKYLAIVGPFQNETEVTVLPSSPAIIHELEDAFFVEVGCPAQVEFLAEDAHGNKIEFDKAEGQRPEGRQRLEGQYPEGQRPQLLEEQLLPGDFLEAFVTDPDCNLIRDIELSTSPEGNLIVNFLPEQAGNYLVESFIKNTGISASSIVRARRFGEIVNLDLVVEKGKDALLRISGNKEQRNSLELGLVLKEQYGFTDTTSTALSEDIVISTKHPELAVVEKTAEGKIMVKERGKPGIATITATYTEKDKTLQDSLDIHILGIPTRIKTAVKTDDLNARVEAVLLCKDSLPTHETGKKYSIKTPPEISILYQNEFIHGRANFALEAESYGSYEITIISADGIVEKITVNFEEKSKPAQKVVLFIDQDEYFKDGKPAKMSASPWISYGDVFVPIDFIADILGAKVLTPSLAEKIILQGEEISIVIDKNELKLTLQENKSKKILPIEPLFLQKKEESYFVPAADIARILGAEVDYLPNPKEIEHVTLTIPRH